MGKFKNINNVYYTKSLFLELTVDPEVAIYTTQEEDRIIDGRLYQSVYRLFINSGDPTGYAFSRDYLGSWHHYELLYKSDWFKTIIDKAIAELEIKIRSEALVNVIKESKDKASKSAFQANKYLLDKSWIEKDSQVGRPTKAKIKEEAQKIINDLEEVEEIHSRIVPLN